jgi:hypothetical protein
MIVKTFKEFLSEKAVTNTKLKIVVASFCRMNPATAGHLKLMNKMVDVAKKYNGTAQLYLSHSQDPKKNPLHYNDKFMFVSILIPRGLELVDSKVNNPFEMVEELAKKFDRIIIVAGSDRIEEYKRAEQYADGKEFEVVSAGDRDPDAEGVSGISASKMRKFASDNDYENFKKGTGISERYSKELFNQVRIGMGLE